MNHHSVAVNQDTSSTLAEILLSLMNDLVKSIMYNLQLTFRSKTIDFKKISNISLFICGGIQQEPDYVRLAFALLQQPLDPEVIKLFPASSPELFLCLQLNYRTTIITAVSFLLPDEVEDMAAIAGKTFTGTCAKQAHYRCLYTVATKIIRPPVLKIFFDLYLLDEESYRALVFSVL